MSGARFAWLYIWSFGQRFSYSQKGGLEVEREGMLTWAKLRDGRRNGTSAHSGNHWDLAESAHVSYLPKQLFRARATAFGHLIGINP